MHPNHRHSQIGVRHSSTRPNPRSRRKLSRAIAEPLEPRRLLTALFVNSLLDNSIPNDGQVTLREAITAANNDTATDLGDTGNGADTITFNLGAGAHTIQLQSALPALASDVSILGSGANLLTVNANVSEESFYDGRYRVFTITSGNVTLSGMTISGGETNFTDPYGVGGGGIGNFGGNVSVLQCTVRANWAQGFGDIDAGGGGIVNYGTMIVDRCLVTSNTVGGNNGLGDLSQNVWGGGIANFGNSLTVTNSTVVNNIAATIYIGFGGGIYGASIVGNCTIANNVVTIDTFVGADYSNIERGGGVANCTVHNSIIAGNSAPTNPDADGSDTSDHNFIGTTDGDPMLNDLAYNGGPTMTMLPKPNSPVINAGNPLFNPGPGATDQRGTGYARVSGGRVDIGAVEVQVPDQPPVATLKGPATAWRIVSIGFNLTAIDPDLADNAAGFTYTLDFGDGTPAKTILPTAFNGQLPGLNVTHVYTAEGTYNVTLTATDVNGATSAPFNKTIVISGAVAGAAADADPNDPAKTALFVGGTSGNDKIALTLSSGFLLPTVNGQKFGQTPSGFAGITGGIYLFGYAGNDEITVPKGINNPVFMLGGGGDDKLTNQGAGPTILSGNDGADTLTAGPGRAILIGGNGKDKLSGNSSDDILIGAKTIYDSNLIALGNLMKEWNSPNLYSQRVAHLTTNTGGGFNGATLIRPGIEVTDDAAIDTLTAGSGNDLWFASILGTNKDTLTDYQATETRLTL